MLGADKGTEEGRRFLKSRSPLYFANRVKNPLLIIHGSNDPRVKVYFQRSVFDTDLCIYII